MTGVYTPIGTDLSFAKNFNPDVELTKSEYSIYQQGFNGFAEITEKTVKDMDMKLVAGVIPNGEKDEIAVSSLVFETFKTAGYWDTVTTQPDGKGGKKPVYTASVASAAPVSNPAQYALLFSRSPQTSGDRADAARLQASRSALYRALPR